MSFPHDDETIQESADTLAASDTLGESAAHSEFPGPNYVGTILNGRYIIDRELGRGSIGVVYFARDRNLHDRPVVVKVLLEKSVVNEWARRKFKQEAEALARIDHPGIVNVLDAGEMPDGNPFLVMQYIEGYTLRGALISGPLPPRTALKYISQIANALDAAHKVGIFHRDLKPENIMINRAGGDQVKIIDFGIALVTDSQVSAETGSSFVAGTVLYMSPEQLRSLPISGASDQFALGVIAYEMLVGKRPFLPKTMFEMLDLHRSGPARKPTEINPDFPQLLDIVIGRVLAYEPAERFPSATAFAEALCQTLGEAEFLPTEIPKGETEKGNLRKETTNSPLGKTGNLGRGTVLMERGQRFRIAALAGILTLATVGGYLGWRQYEARKQPEKIGSQLPGVRTLAILPFRNLKPDPQSDYLGASLADGVVTKLGYARNLVVRPLVSNEKYRNQDFDPRTAAAELKVDTLLTGTYLKEGRIIRITLRLIDASSNSYLWQESLDVSDEKLLTVQDRVAGQVLAGLHVSLSQGEQDMIAREKPKSPEAYEFYLRGVDCYLRSEYRTAVELLEQSVERDGGYAPAWAHLGRAHTACASFKFGGKDDYEKAASAYRLALAINPQQIEANVFLANFLTDTNRVEEAVPLLQAALKTNPNHAEAHWEMGYAYRYAGMLDESIRECETARRIDPEVKLRSSAMNAYFYRGRYTDFVRSIPEGEESAFLVFYRGFGKYYAGDFKGARTDLEKAHSIDPTLLFTQVGFSLARAREGDRQTGIRLMRILEAKIDANEIGDAEGIYKVAQAYAVCGDKAAALRVLKHSVDNGFFCYPYIAEDPLLAEVHGEKAFQDILQTAKIRHEAFIKRFALR